MAASKGEKDDFSCMMEFSSLSLGKLSKSFTVVIQPLSTHFIKPNLGLAILDYSGPRRLIFNLFELMA